MQPLTVQCNFLHRPATPCMPHFQPPLGHPPSTPLSSVIHLLLCCVPSPLLRITHAIGRSRRAAVPGTATRTACWIVSPRYVPCSVFVGCKRHSHSLCCITRRLVAHFLRSLLAVLSTVLDAHRNELSASSKNRVEQAAEDASPPQQSSPRAVSSSSPVPGAGGASVVASVLPSDVPHQLAASSSQQPHSGSAFVTSVAPILHEGLVQAPAVASAAAVATSTVEHPQGMRSSARISTRKHISIYFVRC